MSVVDKIAESIDRVTDVADDLKDSVVDELKEIGADFRDGFQAGTEAMKEVIKKAYEEGIKVPLDNAIEKIEDITGIELDGDDDLNEILETIQDKLLEELLEYLSTLSIVVELKAEGKAKVHLSTSLFSYDIEFDVCTGFTYNFKLLDWTRVNLSYNIDNRLIKFKVEINDKLITGEWQKLKFDIPTTLIPSMMRKQCDEDEDDDDISKFEEHQFCCNGKLMHSLEDLEKCIAGADILFEDYTLNTIVIERQKNNNPRYSSVGTDWELISTFEGFVDFSVEILGTVSARPIGTKGYTRKRTASGQICWNYGKDCKPKEAYPYNPESGSANTQADSVKPSFYIQQMKAIVSMLDNEENIQSGDGWSWERITRTSIVASVIPLKKPFIHPPGTIITNNCTIVKRQPKEKIPDVPMEDENCCSMIRQILERLGGEEFTALMQDSLTDPKAVQTLTTVPEIILKGNHYLEELTGQYPIEYKIQKEVEYTVTGKEEPIKKTEEVPITLKNQAEALAELYGMLYKAIDEIALINNIAVKSLLNSELLRQALIKTSARVESIQDYLDFAIDEEELEYPSLISVGKDDLDAMLRESKQKMRVTELSSSEQTLKEKLLELSHAAAITRARHFVKTDDKFNFLERIKGLAEIGNEIKEKIGDEKWDKFVDWLEDEYAVKMKNEIRPDVKEERQ